MSLPELNKESIAFGLKVFSTTALGLYAGQSLYINAVEVPANLDHEPEHSLQNWQRNFHHASHFAVSMNQSLFDALIMYKLTCLRVFSCQW